MKKIETYFENAELNRLRENSTLNFSKINATLYPYQKEGVEFSVLTSKRSHYS